MDAFSNFLKFGNESGQGSAPDLRLEAVPNVVKALKSGDPFLVQEIRNAENRDAAVFALALAASFGNAAVRSAAFQILPEVCTQSKQLFDFCSAAKGLRGWGRGMRTAIACWYTNLLPDQLTSLLSEEHLASEWTHRDLLRMAHPKPPTEAHRKAFLQLTQSA